MAIIKSQFVFHTNNPSISILKNSINKGSLTELLEIKERSRELNGLQLNSASGGKEKTIIKEELIINDITDDSDLEVSSYFFKSNNHQQKRAKGSLSQPNGIIDNNTLENSDNAHKTQKQSEIVVISLSDDDNDDNSVDCNDSELMGAKPFGEQKSNYSLSSFQPFIKELGYEILSDEFIDIFNPSKKNIEVTLESDEECVMYDFSNLTANDILEAAKNNKLVENKNLFDLKIIKSKSQSSSNKNFPGKKKTNSGTTENFVAETSFSRVNGKTIKDLEIFDRTSQGSSTITNTLEIINESSHNLEHEMSRGSSTLTNTSEIIDDLSYDFESNTLPDADHFNIKTSSSCNDQTAKTCITCSTKLPSNLKFDKCESCRSMLPEKMKFISPDQIRFPCIVCSRVFISEQSLKAHTPCRGKSRYNCADCSFTTSSSDDFDSHVIKNHALQTHFKCKPCKKMFKTLHSLQIHQKLHCTKKRKAYYCAHCSYRCYNKREKILDHLRYYHLHLFTGKMLSCQKCGTKWSNIFKFNDHLGTCSGNYEVELEKQRGMKMYP